MRRVTQDDTAFDEEEEEYGPAMELQQKEGDDVRMEDDPDDVEDDLEEDDLEVEDDLEENGDADM